MKNLKLGTRRLIAIGGSLGVTIPAGFIKKNGWKAGDKVGLVLNDVLVIVRPILPKEVNNGS